MGHAAHVPYYAYKNEYQAARGQWTFYYDGVPEEVPRLASGAVDYSHLLLLFIFLNLLFCTIYGVYMSSLLPSMNWPGIPHVNEWAMLFAVKEYPIMPGEQDTWVHEFYIGTYLNFIKTGYVISVERITLMIYNVHLLISTQRDMFFVPCILNFSDRFVFISFCEVCQTFQKNSATTSFGRCSRQIGRAFRSLTSIRG